MSEPLDNIRMAIEENAAPKEDIRNVTFDEATNPEYYRQGTSGQDSKGGGIIETITDREQAQEPDLILGGEEPTGEEAEYYEDYPDLHSEITSATNALSAIDGLDTAMLNKRQQDQVKAIKRKSIAILHRNISDIYDEVFGREEKNEEDDDE